MTKQLQLADCSLHQPSNKATAAESQRALLHQGQLTYRHVDVRKYVTVVLYRVKEQFHKLTWSDYKCSSWTISAAHLTM